MRLQYTLHFDRAAVCTKETLRMYPCPQITLNYEVGNKVKFTNLKIKYSADENLVVSYTLRENVHASTRDWIGIFPRGWTNLEQYLTFEHVIYPPREANTCERTIIFLKSFFSKQVSLLTDYQFVYVNRKMDILGMSPYFRFTSLTPSDNEIPSDVQDTTTIGQENATATDGYPPVIVTLDNGSASKLPIVRENGATGVQSQDSRRFSVSPISSSSTAANRDKFLRSHVDKLAARVMRLERDLELANATVKQEKLAQASLTQRLNTYEAFVKDMFRKLSTQETIKIIGGSGDEVIVRRVFPDELPSRRKKFYEEPLTNALAKNPTDNDENVKVSAIVERKDHESDAKSESEAGKMEPVVESLERIFKNGKASGSIDVNALDAAIDSNSNLTQKELQSGQEKEGSPLVLEVVTQIEARKKKKANKSQK